jgi:hypothetical protein
MAALAVMLFGIATMSRYGVTFDSPALFYSGDRTLFAITHPTVPDALDLKSKTEPAGFTPDFARHPEWEDPENYPVAIDLVCAVTSYLFHQRWKLLDLVDGHHLGLILVYALTVAAYLAYTSRLLGLVAGVAATVALVLFPSAMGHSFNNPKDWPCAMLYGLTVLSFALGVIERRPRHVWLSGVWLGLSLSAKLNGVFALVTVFLWAPFAFGVLFARRRRAAAPLFAPTLLVPYLGLLLFFALWPWLRHGKVPEIWDHLDGYMRHFLSKGLYDRPYWSGYSLKCVAFMTQPLTLVAAAIFVLSGWFGSRQALSIWLLLLLWVGLPLARVAMPRAVVYDGNRHFIEYVPALCAMAGGGVSGVVTFATRRLQGRLRPPWLKVALATAAAAACATLAWPLAQYYPYEVEYFNVFAGGLGGAQRDAVLVTRPEHRATDTWGCEGDFWFTSLRDGLRDVLKAAGPAANVASCGPWGAQISANMPQGASFTIGGSDPAFIYASPREAACTFKFIRNLESQRKVIRRVERDGGLVYEVFGEHLATSVPPVTPENWYTRNLK